jgi:hypothetical protein
MFFQTFDETKKNKQNSSQGAVYINNTQHQQPCRMSMPEQQDSSLERALKQGNIGGITRFSGESELVSKLIIPHHSS